jgi:ADP-ribose pyrophosphatase YjhB (NUDIX family)
VDDGNPRTRGRLTVARTEYYDDPNAPKPNSMVVAASAVVTDDHGRILLQRRRDNDLWALPGGGMDLTDSLPGTAVREVKEETGLDVEITGLVGTYTDPKHVIAYTNGEVRRQFNICFTARVVGGHLQISDESTELRFVPPTELEQTPHAPHPAAQTPALPGKPRASLSRLSGAGTATGACETVRPGLPVSSLDPMVDDILLDRHADTAARDRAR